MLKNRSLIGNRVRVRLASLIQLQVSVNKVNVGEYLIAKGHALRYDGGTREELDWDTLDQGLMVE